MVNAAGMLMNFGVESRLIEITLVALAVDVRGSRSAACTLETLSSGSSRGIVRRAAHLCL